MYDASLSRRRLRVRIPSISQKWTWGQMDKMFGCRPIRSGFNSRHVRKAIRVEDCTWKTDIEKYPLWVLTLPTWSYELHGVRTGLSRQEERGFNSLWDRKNGDKNITENRLSLWEFIDLEYSKKLLGCGFDSLYHRTSSKWSARNKIHRVAHEKSIWECANVGGLGRSVKSLLRLSRFESYHSHR